MVNMANAGVISPGCRADAAARRLRTAGGVMRRGLAGGHRGCPWCGVVALVPCIKRSGGWAGRTHAWRLLPVRVRLNLSR